MDIVALIWACMVVYLHPDLSSCVYIVSQHGEAIKPVFEAMFQIFVSQNFKLLISLK
jgi:hypothetical protein